MGEHNSASKGMNLENRKPSRDNASQSNIREKPERSSGQSGQRPTHKPGAKQASKGSKSSGMGLGGRAKKGAAGAEKAARGASKASEGASRAAQGVGRVAAGDLTGIGDAVKGAKQAYDGSKELKEGLDETKEAMSQDGNQSGDNDTPVDGNGNQMDLLDRSGEEDMINAISNKGKSGLSSNLGLGGMKDLMADVEDGDADTLMSGGSSSSDDMDMSDIKQAVKTTAQGAGLGAGVMVAKTALSLMQWLKMMMAKGMALLQGAWAGILGFVSTIASWVATVTGLSAFVSTVLTIGSIVTSVIGGVVTVVAFVAGTVAQRDGFLCLPDQTSVSNSVIEWQESGEYSLMRQENLKKSWSLFSEMGISDIVAAGILGNFDHESGLDPTGVETIYDERYHIGPKKAQAEVDNFKMSVMNPSYYAQFNGAVVDAGIGLGQWSNGRNITLRNYASARGLQWYDIGTQLAFMFDGDNSSDIQVLKDIASTPDITIDEATERFMLEWERPNAAALHLEKRQASAARLYLELQTTTVDKDYAQSIISGMNVDLANSNHNRSAYFQDDGCGNTIRSHYSGQADGTGVFPADASGTIWSPLTIANSVKTFTHNPSLTGMSYGSNTGWDLNNGYPGQCVAFASAYMQKLYPGTVAPTGHNGETLAEAWYNAYKDTLGGSLSNVPAAGAIFQYDTGQLYGHTGIVDHVFANGDMLVVEQNIRGYSGDNNGTPNTWSWRLITKNEYTNGTSSSSNWKFYKPAVLPQWGSGS